jgi:hypothetical protein
VGVFHDLGDRVDPSRSRVRPRVVPSAVEKQEHHVPASPSPRRTSALGAVLVVLALTASACGGDDADASDEPTRSSSASATATPSTTPTPTPTETPLSPFEDRAPVKAARAWAEAQAQAINAGDRAMRAVEKVATAQGLAATKAVSKGDLDHGYQLPGPAPFTPINVQIRGGHARLNLCMLDLGWSVDPKTGKRVGPHKVEPVVFEMVREGGQWKFDSGSLGTGDCGSVKVVEVTW